MSKYSRSPGTESMKDRKKAKIMQDDETDTAPTKVAMREDIQSSPLLVSYRLEVLPRTQADNSTGTKT